MSRINRCVAQMQLERRYSLDSRMSMNWTHIELVCVHRLADGLLRYEIDEEPSALDRTYGPYENLDAAVEAFEAL